MELHSLLSFLTVAMLLTIAPGPDIVFVITQSVSSGRRAGIATSLGLCTGLLVHTSLASFGISELLRHSPTAFMVLKYTGAIYLFYLAWQSLLDRNKNESFGSSPKRKESALYKQGILMNLLNPKVALFFLALLPQFVNSRTGNVPFQMLLLGIIFIVQAIIIFIIVSVFAGIFGERLKNNPKIFRYINYTKAGILILIGISIAFGELTLK